MRGALRPATKRSAVRDRCALPAAREGRAVDACVEDRLGPDAPRSFGPTCPVGDAASDPRSVRSLPRTRGRRREGRRAASRSVRDVPALTGDRVPAPCLRRCASSGRKRAPPIVRSGRHGVQMGVAKRVPWGCVRRMRSAGRTPALGTVRKRTQAAGRRSSSGRWAAGPGPKAPSQLLSCMLVSRDCLCFAALLLRR